MTVMGENKMDRPVATGNTHRGISRKTVLTIVIGLVLIAVIAIVIALVTSGDNGNGIVQPGNDNGGNSGGIVVTTTPPNSSTTTSTKPGTTILPSVTPTIESPTILPQFAKNYPFVASIAPEVQGKIEARYKVYIVNGDPTQGGDTLQVEIVLKNTSSQPVAWISYRWIITSKNNNNLRSGEEKRGKTVNLPAGQTQTFTTGGIGNASNFFHTTDTSSLITEVTILEIK